MSMMAWGVLGGTHPAPSTSLALRSGQALTPAQRGSVSSNHQVNAGHVSSFPPRRGWGGGNAVWCKEEVCRSVAGGQGCGLPARKRPRWPRSQGGQEGGGALCGAKRRCVLGGGGPGWAGFQGGQEGMGSRRRATGRSPLPSSSRIKSQFGSTWHSHAGFQSPCKRCCL